MVIDVISCMGWDGMNGTVISDHEDMRSRIGVFTRIEEGGMRAA